jgi:predicted GNAT superfamily acetyltransferase
MEARDSSSQAVDLPGSAGGFQKVTVRSLDSTDEFREVERAQQIIWGGSDLEVVPSHLLATAVHSGGFLAGAFLAVPNEGALGPEQASDAGSSKGGAPQKLVGFVFGFLGTEEHSTGGPHLKHCSHMLGVLPQYRDRGIGFQLKRAQREFVLRQGLDLITWTFDPLESRNAHLNLTRLGGIARRYRREAYGAMRDALNRGMPTDRLEVEWWIRSDRVIQRLSEPPEPKSPPDACINRTRWLNGELYPDSWAVPLQGERAAVEFPTQFRRMMQENPPLALEWRLHLRQILETLFAQGWVAEELWDRTREDPLRARYILRKPLAG